MQEILKFLEKCQLMGINQPTSSPLSPIFLRIILDLLIPGIRAGYIFNNSQIFFSVFFSDLKQDYLS